jgi:uncharacterized protein (TIGR02246 family)
MNRSVWPRNAPLVTAGALAVALAIASASSARGQTSSARKSADSDEAAVRAAVMQRVQGQRARDAVLSASVFADDAVWINAFGVRRVGRAAIEKFLADLYADPGYAQAQLVDPPQIEEIMFVRPDVAVVRTFHRTQGQRLSNGTVIAERRTHNTMTVTRERAGWKVRYEIVTDERTASPQQ